MPFKAWRAAASMPLKNYRLNGFLDLFQLEATVRIAGNAERPAAGFGNSEKRADL